MCKNIFKRLAAMAVCLMAGWLVFSQCLVVNTLAVTKELRGIWISYLEMGDMAQNKTEEEFTKNVELMLDNIKSLKLTDVFFQVRAFSDAFYKSSVFPQSHILTGEQGKDCGYDPLKIMVEKGHEKGLKIHAWINPYRIQNPGTDNPGSNIKLAETHPAKKAIDSDDNKKIIKLENGGIYFQPGLKSNVDLVVKGVEEIVRNYNIDGIHVDDYFYPTTDEQIDKLLYEEYCKNGGKLPLGDWRRGCVNVLIKEIAEKIKTINPNVLFGISPAGNVKYNLESVYADVAKWMEEGMVDYLCPQIYWGFEHSRLPFDWALSTWLDLKKADTVKLYVGLAAYKAGLEDSYSLDNGRDEWIRNSDILKRQILACRGKKCDGFVLFRYGSLFNPDPQQQEAVKKELSNMISILKD